jgi:hypothetical protein
VNILFRVVAAARLLYNDAAALEGRRKMRHLTRLAFVFYWALHSKHSYTTNYIKGPTQWDHTKLVNCTAMCFRSTTLLSLQHTPAITHSKLLLQSKLPHHLRRIFFRNNANYSRQLLIAMDREDGLVTSDIKMSKLILDREAGIKKVKYLKYSSKTYDSKIRGGNTRSAIIVIWYNLIELRDFLSGSVVVLQNRAI